MGIKLKVGRKKVKINIIQKWEKRRTASIKREKELFHIAIQFAEKYGVNLADIFGSPFSNPDIRRVLNQKAMKARARNFRQVNEFESRLKAAKAKGEPLSAAQQKWEEYVSSEHYLNKVENLGASIEKLKRDVAACIHDLHEAAGFTSTPEANWAAAEEMVRRFI